MPGRKRARRPEYTTRAAFEVVGRLTVLGEVDAVDLVVRSDPPAHRVLDREADQRREYAGPDNREHHAEELVPEQGRVTAVQQAVHVAEQTIDALRRGVGADQADQEAAGDAADEVDPDDVERVVEPDLELQPDCQGAQDAGQGADRECTDQVDGTTRWSDRDQAGDDTGGGAE